MGVLHLALLSLALADGEAAPPMMESLGTEPPAESPQVDAAATPRTALEPGRRIWLLGAISTGTAPSVTPRFGMGLAFDLGESFTFEATLTGGVPAVFAGGPVPGAGYQLWPVAGGSLAAGVVLRFGRLNVIVCPVAQLEAVQSTGVGVSTPMSGFAAWLAFGFDARALIALGERFFVHLAVGERIAVNRPSVVFERFRSVFDAPVFSSGAEAGLGVRW